VVATLLAMLLPIATEAVIDRAIPGSDRDLLGELALVLVGAAVGAGLYKVASGVYLLRLETHADVTARGAVWDRLLGLPASFFRRFPVGDLQTRVSAAREIRAILSGTTLRTLFASLLALLNLGLLIYYSPALALVAFLTGVGAVALTTGGCWLLLPLERRQEALRGELVGAMVQLVQGVSKLRVAAAEERAFAFWAEKYGEEQTLVGRDQGVRDALSVGFVWLGAISAVTVFALAVPAVEAGELTAGQFLAFHTAFGAFLGGAVALGKAGPDLLRVAVLEERALPILETLPEVTREKSDPGTLRGELALERVVFRYRPDGPPVLHDLSIRVEPGQLVALVGPSGGGKSTVLRLLLGFEQPESGAVLIDGQDARGLDLEAVRRQCGVVLQDGRLGAGTIFTNVSSGVGATRAAVREALSAAALLAEVDAMPLGLDTVVAEGGVNLSAGQRQRVLIARALLGGPRLLLLDEATNALDERSQAAVQRSLDALQATRVVVAHRLSTVRAADRIYVIDGGRVVEQGSYAQLVAADGPFAAFVRRQAG
jgi:NHLM bacteriocin system ABC transporter ATP-binding protein